MIELIIAMVLLAIALGLVMTGLLSALNGSGGVQAGAISDASIGRVTASFADDVARAQTLGRSEGLLRDEVQLAKAVRSGGSVISSDPANPEAVDIDDVVSATSSSFTIWADVTGDKGVECVTWTAGTSSGRYEVVRAVHATCGGAELERQVMLRAAANAEGMNLQPFSYDLVCNASLCVGSGATAKAPCRPWNETSVAGTQRRWIVGIKAAFSTVSQQGKSAANGAGAVEMSIRSRDIEIYRSALGC